MGPNCPKHIVIVSETFADLDKELHMGGGGVRIAVHKCHKKKEGFCFFLILQKLSNLVCGEIC
jgi:hypothetical protein